MDKKNVRLSQENRGLKDSRDRLKELNLNLEVENGGLLKERDLYKNEAKRFEESYDKLNVAHKEKKDELTYMMQKQIRLRQYKTLSTPKKIDHEPQ